MGSSLGQEKKDPATRLGMGLARFLARRFFEVGGGSGSAEPLHRLTAQCPKRTERLASQGGFDRVSALQ